MEVLGKNISDQDRTYCQPCSEDGENMHASAFCTVCKKFMCSTCENEHRTLKTTKRHILLDKESMPASLSDQFNKEDVPCNIHPNEIIKYLCPTHETVNCVHCVVFEHRSCKIRLISEITDSFENGQEYGDIKTSIAKLLKNVNDYVNSVEGNISMILKVSEDEVKKIKDYREKVNDYFNERETCLLETIKEMRDMDKTRLDTLKQQCDNIKAKLDEIKLTLDAQERNSVKLFIEAKRATEKVECLEKVLKDLKRENTVQRYEFIKDPATERLIDAKIDLGIVRKDRASGKQTVPIDLTSMRLTAAQSIPVRSPTDTKECWLTAMLLLPGDRLLLADRNNNTVKLVDLQTSSILSQIELPGKPWGMCFLPSDKVAICLNDKSSVVFLETRGQITIGTSIKVDGNCLDIAYRNGEIFVSFAYGRVVKMDVEGNIINKIDKDRSSSFPNLTLMDDGQKAAIFVSDYIYNTITKLDMDLTIIQKFNNHSMQNPRGLTAVGNQLLICSYGSHKLLRLDLSSGKIIEMMGKSYGIQYPYSAVFSQGQNNLYITCGNTGKNDLNNIVHMYRASRTYKLK